MALLADSAEVGEESGVGEVSSGVDSGEVGDDCDAGVGDSRGVLNEALSSTGEFSGVGDPGVCNGLPCGPVGNISGVAEEGGRPIETSRL